MARTQLQEGRRRLIFAVSAAVPYCIALVNVIVVVAAGRQCPCQLRRKCRPVLR